MYHQSKNGLPLIKSGGEMAYQWVQNSPYLDENHKQSWIKVPYKHCALFDKNEQHSLGHMETLL